MKKNMAIGWACNLNDIFVRFPYEKCQSLMNLNTKISRRSKVKKVFREGVRQILDDIIENNNTCKLQGVGYQKGEIHFEAIRGEEFERVRKNGKFAEIDFLESLFTGYQLYLYIHGKRDNFLHRRKFPIYFGNLLKKKLVEYTNQGKIYC